MPRRSRSRSRSSNRTLLIIALALGLLVVAYLLRQHEPWRPAPDLPAGPDALRVTFIDVEQGDAILIQLGEVDLLIDAGPRGACEHLSEVLQRIHGELELLAITHPHDDHYGCAPATLQQHRVQRLVTNGESRGPPREAKPPASWVAFEESVQRAGLTPESLRVGSVFSPAPGLSLTVLASGSPAGGAFRDSSSGEDINNDSLVLMLEFAGRRVLLSGDIEVAAGKMLVRKRCPPGGLDCPTLQADVLKVPHHGSADFAPEFLRAVQPQWAVISADHANRKHFLPRAGTIRALQEVGAKVLSTSAKGTEDVTLTISPKGELSWQAPQVPVFAWDNKTEVTFAPPSVTVSVP